MPTALHKPLSIDDAQREGTHDMLASSMALGWQGIFAHHFRVYPGLPKERALPVDCFVLHTKGSANYLRRRWDSGYSTPQTLCVMPAIIPSEYGIVEHGENIMFGVSLDLMMSVVSGISKGDPETHKTQERFLFRDSLVEQIGWMLIRLLHEADDTARLYAESLGVTLAHHMLRFYGLTNSHITLKLPTISQPQIRRVLEYLDVHFAQPIALADLA